MKKKIDIIYPLYWEGQINHVPDPQHPYRNLEWIDLFNRLSKICVKQKLISSKLNMNVEYNQFGKIVSKRQSFHRGVQFKFTYNKRRHLIQCDKYKSTLANLRSVIDTLEAKINQAKHRVRVSSFNL